MEKEKQLLVRLEGIKNEMRFLELTDFESFETVIEISCMLRLGIRKEKEMNKEMYEKCIKMCEEMELAFDALIDLDKDEFDCGCYGCCCEIKKE